MMGCVPHRVSLKSEGISTILYFSVFTLHGMTQMLPTMAQLRDSLQVLWRGQLEILKPHKVKTKDSVHEFLDHTSCYCQHQEICLQDHWSAENNSKKGSGSKIKEHVFRLYHSKLLATFWIMKFPTASRNFSLHFHTKTRPTCPTNHLLQKQQLSAWGKMSKVWCHWLSANV